jgi:hypothetical protein
MIPLELQNESQIHSTFFYDIRCVSSWIILWFFSFFISKEWCPHCMFILSHEILFSARCLFNSETAMKFKIKINKLLFLCCLCEWRYRISFYMTGRLQCSINHCMCCMLTHTLLYLSHCVTSIFYFIFLMWLKFPHSPSMVTSPEIVIWYAK